MELVGDLATPADCSGEGPFELRVPVDVAWSPVAACNVDDACAEIDVDPGETATVAKTISVKQHSTRTHYPGTHRIDLLVNGDVRPGPSFELSD